MTDIEIPTNESPANTPVITSPNEPHNASPETVVPQLTILRIKRKRNEEPLDALLVQQQLQSNNPKEKKSRLKEGDAAKNGAQGEAFPKLFRLAETVEEGSFRDVTKTRQLGDRIRSQIKNRQSWNRNRDTSGGTNSVARGEVPRTETQQRGRGHHIYVRCLSSCPIFRTPSLEKSYCSSSFTRYSDDDEPESDLFQLYDAIKEDVIDPKVIPDSKEDPYEDDQLLCNFIPMLREYLTVNERRDANSKSSSDGDYVYDVYYRDDSAAAAAVHQNVGS
ncbi:hypothetical protein BC936DRAFT_141397, partial [Jimgerdemannia flammicorona]